MENQNNQNSNQIPPVSPPVIQTPSVSPVGQTPPTPSVSNPINPPAGEPKSKLPILIIGIILFLLIAGSAAGFYVFKQQSLKTTTKPTPIPVVQKQIPSPTPDPTANWKTYTNTVVGFTIKYPPTFLSPKIPGVNIEGDANGTEDNGANVIFGNREPIGRFTLVIKPYSKTISDLSSEYIKSATIPAGAPGSLAQSAKFLRDTSIDGAPAQWYTTIIGSETTSNIVLFIGKGHAFSFATQATQDDVNLMNQILSTFKFTDSIEQSKIYADNNLQNIALEFLTANVRYYANHNNYPWDITGACQTEAGSANPSGITLSTVSNSCLIDITSYLSTSFMTGAATKLSLIYFSESKLDFALCYLPTSKLKQFDSNTRFTASGKEGENCKSKGGTNDCYSCIR